MIFHKHYRAHLSRESPNFPKGREMPKFLVQLVFAAVILQAGGAVHAGQDAAASTGQTDGRPFRVAATGRPAVSRSPSVLNLGPGGVCCGTFGSPVIPPDTPMRNPRAPAAPRLPGQQPATGTTFTAPGD
jgi:hypothetical protein